MQVVLSPAMRKFVDEKVQAGAFDSPSQMINLALEALQSQSELEHLESLRAEVSIGIAESRQGQSVPLDMNEVRAEVARERSDAGAR